MRILYRYITRDFLVSFTVTLLVFLFVMALGNVFRVIDLFSRGVSGRLILQFFSCGMPFSLIFAIPMSVLAAAFLNFSRMASDREILAMQSCGVSVWQVIQPPIVISALLCIVCVYINCELAPASHYARRLLKNKLGVETPLNFLDEGRFIRDFPGYTIYIGRKDGRKIYDVVLYEFGDQGARQTVRAAAGEISTPSNKPGRVLVNLRQVRIEQADDHEPGNLSLVRRVSADEYPVEFDVAELMSKGVVHKKRADLSMREVFDSLDGDLRFRPEDFKDLPALARQLIRTPLRSAAARALSPATLRRLETAGSDQDWAALLPALTDEFNRLLEGPSLYSPGLFKGVELDGRARELLARAPRGADLMRLNRMLLEQLFPGLLARHYLSNLDDDDFQTYRTSLMVEASTRLALSFSCFAFVLLGAALGIRIHRRESSIGMALSLVLVFVFYFFIILADSLVSQPQFYPHLIVWIPFAIAEAIGFTLLRRRPA